MDNSKQDKRIGRAGEWGKLTKVYRRNAHKRSRRNAKRELQKEIAVRS